MFRSWFFTESKQEINDFLRDQFWGRLWFILEKLNFSNKKQLLDTLLLARRRLVRDKKNYNFSSETINQLKDIGKIADENPTEAGFEEIITNLDKFFIDNNLGNEDWAREIKTLLMNSFTKKMPQTVKEFKPSINALIVKRIPEIVPLLQNFQKILAKCIKKTDNSGDIKNLVIKHGYLASDAYHLSLIRRLENTWDDFYKLNPFYATSQRFRDDWAKEQERNPKFRLMTPTEKENYLKNPRFPDWLNPKDKEWIVNNFVKNKDKYTDKSNIVKTTDYVRQLTDFSQCQEMTDWIQEFGPVLKKMLDLIKEDYWQFFKKLPINFQDSQNVRVFKLIYEVLNRMIKENNISIIDMYDPLKEAWVLIKNGSEKNIGEIQILLSMVASYYVI